MKPVLTILLLHFAVKICAQTNTYPFPPSGSVGIGTTSPASGYLLDVRGSIYLRATSPGLRLWDQTGSSQSVMDIYSSESEGAYIGANYGSYAVPLTLNVVGSSNMLFKTNSTERMRIDPDGNVGIGTISPSHKFDVKGSIASTSYYPSFVLAAGYWGGNTFSIRSGTNTGSTSDGDYTTFINPVSKGFNFRQGANDVLTIISAGNVGIGTISPSEKLSVNGNISTKKLIVTQTGWSDYVFDKEYKLRSLSSLEQYINQHKHLPEVPSAKEVEEKGISVGDNQALLLKKIEELTLYVIDLKKEINALKKKNNKK